MCSDSMWVPRWGRGWTAAVLAVVWIVSASSAAAVYDSGFDPGASLVDLMVSVQVPVTLSEKVEVRPGIKYMAVVDSDLKDGIKAVGGDTSEIAVSIAGTVKRLMS